MSLITKGLLGGLVTQGVGSTDNVPLERFGALVVANVSDIDTRLPNHLRCLCVDAVPSPPVVSTPLTASWLSNPMMVSLVRRFIDIHSPHRSRRR